MKKLFSLSFLIAFFCAFSLSAMHTMEKINFKKIKIEKGFFEKNFNPTTISNITWQLCATALLTKHKDQVLFKKFQVKHLAYVGAACKLIIHTLLFAYHLDDHNQYKQILGPIHSSFKYEREPSPLKYCINAVKNHYMAAVVTSK